MRRTGRTRIPWLRETWWENARVEIWAVHFPYPATSDPSKIAFTSSEERGLADRQTVMRPGAYLARYFGDVLTEADVQRWALAWAVEFAPVELEFARTADDIQDAYENGPNSCMSYSCPHYDGGIHPVRAYAGPDLALAYIRNGAGEIVGRAVVWPDRKQHSRIYGDAERMGGALARAGYTGGTLAGARLARIESGAGLHVPYLDSVQSVRDDGGPYLTIDGDGDIPGDSTTGTASIPPLRDCGAP